MKKLTRNTLAKITAVFLFAVFIGTAAASLLGIVYIADLGGYESDSYSFYKSNACEDITNAYANAVFFHYLPLAQKADLSEEAAYDLKTLQTTFSEENTNFFFTVRDEDGATLLTNYSGQEYGTIITYNFTETTYEHNGSSASITPMTVEEAETQENKTYTVTCYIKNPITATDNYYTPYKRSMALYEARYLLIAALIFSALLALIDFIFLMYSAGRKNGHEKIVLSGLNRLPFELHLGGLAVIAYFIFHTADDFGDYSQSIVSVLAFIFFLMAFGLVVLAGCMAFAARTKAGRWWQNTIICRVLHFILSSIKAIFLNLPLLWKVIVLFLAYLFINFILVLMLFESIAFFALVFGLIFNLGILIMLCLLMLQLHEIKQSGERIASGNFDSKIETRKMRWDVKAHAESLNNIGNGMSIAVEDRLKSERFKTELITNVSHDIKTPLTSIINYVDLMKKETIDNETVVSYIDVLDRQSSRLKKLTEDLVEVSKASTGNIPLSLNRTDVVELLNQSVGEYAERFKSSGLEPVVSAETDNLYILADGRQLWRVFDNLLSNICKYSQPGTRVYLDLARLDSRAVITIKNISLRPLNVSSDELLERFVRGDSARTTEGSGLGLAIANSLVELQKGVFTLAVDGDLFKVTIRFDLFSN